ncbi:tungstate transport system ATP-binding protein [Roseovarius pacificus]|uniref:Tungstate transport system ATP-binding protein n=1 Tax=Roseovarius pacificus TaxID=337701 RepID=A0A1M7BF43_9RHOB|nr:ATP-binding cassette domain-containing protein [Roseovarius pacificus]SHL53620.1 tungstate transport system ATP-binding protein [Roseovarius pacificus]
MPMRDAVTDNIVEFDNLRHNASDSTDQRALALQDVSLTVGDTTLIEDASLSLSGNGITMIMGPNGAGKSMLLKLAHGLIAPTKGTVTWGGEPLNDAGRRTQAMVFQKPVLLRRSVVANVDFVLKARGIRDAARRNDLLDHVGLLDHARQPARLLSGGEQQRLALARALALKPKVMLLDEPTASLDPASVLKIESIVQEAHTAGTKIIFITHDPGQAGRLADDIVFVHRGRVHEHGPADLFLSRPDTQEARDFLQGRIVV